MRRIGWWLRCLYRGALYLDLFCPQCVKRHVDRGEWAHRPHERHLCEHCGHVWRTSSGDDCYLFGREPYVDDGEHCS